MKEATEIKELDMNEYIVIKRDDLRYLSIDLQASMAQIVANINYSRKLIDNKPQNKYLVLNLDDEIDLTWLSCRVDELDNTISRRTYISDIALALVNAIQRAKE